MIYPFVLFENLGIKLRLASNKKESLIGCCLLGHLVIQNFRAKAPSLSGVKRRHSQIGVATIPFAERGRESGKFGISEGSEGGCSTWVVLLGATLLHVFKTVGIA